MSNEDLDINGEPIEDDSESIWDMLKLTDPGDDPYQEEEDEQDIIDSKTEKMDRKLTAKVDKLEHKFEVETLRERTKQFEAAASDLQRDLFKTVASDISTVEDFDKAVTLVVNRSQKMEAAAAQYQEQMNQQAARTVANAWGTGPLGTPQAKRTPDAEEESFKKIQGGDVDELYKSLVGDDAPWMR